MTRRELLLGAILGLLVLPRTLRAQAPAPEPTPLAPPKEPGARAEWFRSLTPEQRDELRARYRRFQAMPEPQRQGLEQRLKRWNRLAPEQRRRARERWKSFRQLPADERERVLRNERHWRSLPPKERRRMRQRFERFRQLTPGQRQRIRRRRAEGGGRKADEDRGRGRD